MCDGVATTPGSETAAELAAATALTAVTGRIASATDWGVLPAQAIAEAQAALSVRTADGAPVHEGATTMAVAVAGPGRVVAANVGDSRTYWVGRDGSARQLSTDDSWVREALDAGVAPEEVKRANRDHEITAWLGEDAGSPEPHVEVLDPTAGGWVIVCSDGLSGYADRPQEMAALLQAGGAPPAGLAQRLTRHALDAGGADNVTVAVLEVPATTGTNGPAG